MFPPTHPPNPSHVCVTVNDSAVPSYQSPRGWTKHLPVKLGITCVHQVMLAIAVSRMQSGTCMVLSHFPDISNLSTPVVFRTFEAVCFLWSRWPLAHATASRCWVMMVWAHR